MKEKDFKAKVERSLKRSNDMEKKRNSGGENNSSNSSNAEENMNYAFAIVDDSVFSSKTSSLKRSSSLRSSWILDHAVTIHVCNDIMAHRFIKNRDGDGRTVTAEGSEWTIQSYGHIVIKRQGEFEIGEMTLLNVCYIPEFMANLVSGHILSENGVHFMSKTGRLYRNEKTFAYAKKKNGHFYIEDNDDKYQDSESENEIFDQKEENQIVLHSFVSYSAYYSQTSSNVKQRTTQDWHQILAHAGNEVIQNLEKSVQEVKISDDKKTSKTNECET